MCNILIINCKICETPIEIHLGDYETSAEEIEVFCKDHIPKENVVVWKSLAKRNRRGIQNLCDKNTHMKVGIRALTKNAKENKNSNHPNAYNIKIIEEI